jgi:hypothetical protein
VIFDLGTWSLFAAFIAAAAVVILLLASIYSIGVEALSKSNVPLMPNTTWHHEATTTTKVTCFVLRDEQSLLKMR